MKKLLTLLFALIAAMSVIGAGCQLAGSETNPEDLENAKVYLEQLYKNQSETTAADYKLHAQISSNGIVYKVVWTSSDTTNVVIGTEVDGNGKISVDINEETPEQISYVLTARIYDANQNYLETTFNRVIPAYNLTSWEEYLAAEDGATLTIKGVVTSIWGQSLGNTYNGMYVQDLNNKGGYYIYGLSSDASAEGVTAGMTVSVTGTYVKNYVELKSATCTVLDSTIRTVEPADYTEIFKNATSLKDTALLEKQTYLVTLKGVELQPRTEDDVTGHYYRFKLGNLTSYVRISSSVCPMSTAEQAQFETDFLANVGNKADVVGIVSVYNGNFYLVPAGVGAYSNYQTVTKTEAEKVATELDGAYFAKTVFTEDETLTLPTAQTYTDVTFTWTSSSDNAVVENGTLKITMPTATTTVTLTLKATCGSVEDTKEFTLTLQKTTLTHAGTEADPYDCADAIAVMNALAKGETYKDDAGAAILVYIKGYVVNAGNPSSYNGQKQQKQFYLADAVDSENTVYVYTANYSDGVSDIALGECIVIKGYLMDYNGTKEVSYSGSNSAYIVSKTNDQQGGGDVDPTPDDPTTSHAGTEADPYDCADAIAVLDSLASGTYYMEGDAAKLVYIKGYVLDPGTYSSQFNNQSKIYIADAVDSEVKLYVYRVYFANDITTISQGDLVIVKGYLTNSSYGKQVSYYNKENAYIISRTEATEENLAKLAFANLSVTTTLNADYTLPTSTLATIVWSVKSGTAIEIVDGVAKVTRGTADAQVVLLAKIGELEKEYTVTVVKADDGQTESKTVTFTCGENVTVDPSKTNNENHYEATTATTTYTETVDGVTLNISNGNKLYTVANDAKGNGCLKLGTSSVAGSFKITSIPAGVKTVKIYVAGYKNNNASVKVNGTTTALTKKSHDGEYAVIEVVLAEGTTEITFEVSSNNRAMVNQIEFVY